VSARFIYDRMTGRDLSEALRELAMPPNAFARIFGVRPEVMSRWLKGDQDIPPWVYPVTRLLSLPHALGEARVAAAEHIKEDREHPERGEYPYQRHNEEDS
jgi:hypothetical protein